MSSSEDSRASLLLGLVDALPSAGHVHEAPMPSPARTTPEVRQADDLALDHVAGLWCARTRPTFVASCLSPRQPLVLVAMLSTTASTTSPFFITSHGAFTPSSRKADIWMSRDALLASRTPTRWVRTRPFNLRADRYFRPLLPGVRSPASGRRDAVRLLSCGTAHSTSFRGHLRRGLTSWTRILGDWRPLAPLRSRRTRRSPCGSDLPLSASRSGLSCVVQGSP